MSAMSVSVETIIADARKLAQRLRDHDTSADHLISRTQALQKQLEAMKQFQNSLNALNEVARHRPRLGLIITLAQENSKIRELQLENKELHQSLEDHQSALQLIMKKYREQMSKLARANQVERGILQCTTDLSEDLESKSEKITEMASVMWHAASLDDQTGDLDAQEIERLELENQLMRHLLEIEGSNVVNGDAMPEKTPPLKNPAVNAETQTGMDVVRADSSRKAATECSADGNSFPDDEPFCCTDFSTLRRPPSFTSPSPGCDVTSSPRLSSSSGSHEMTAVENSPKNNITDGNSQKSGNAETVQKSESLSGERVSGENSETPVESADADVKLSRGGTLKA